MRAMVLRRIVQIAEEPEPLEPAEFPEPVAGPGEVVVEVSCCGICHTELDEIEGRTPPPHLPVVPGHQAVGRVAAVGDGVTTVAEGDRVGVAWIFSACGHCPACRRDDENLCADFRATGRDANGGYAERMVAPADFVHPIPDTLADHEAAPLLCAGAIGYRSLRLAHLPRGGRLGLTGFGASGHLVLKLLRHLDPQATVYCFARNERERGFARELGAVWAGDTAERAPLPLDSIIDTTPVWRPVVEALANLVPGGRLVINAIRKEGTDQAVLLDLDYPSHLWMEREIKSVANVARSDVREFLEIAATAQIRPEVEIYPLEAANRALVELKAGTIRGAKVLKIR